MTLIPGLSLNSVEWNDLSRVATMYSVDENDTVKLLSSVPQPEAGAPVPVVLASEFRIFLAYVVSEPLPQGRNNSFQLNTNDSIAQIEFIRPWAHMFGPPSDEIIEGHPLAGRGLEPYGTFEVHNSSWIRSLVEMNAVHSRHDPSQFANDRHFIFTFHDTTFECIATEIRTSVHVGSMRSAIEAMTTQLE